MITGFLDIISFFNSICLCRTNAIIFRRLKLQYCMYFYQPGNRKELSWMDGIYKHFHPVNLTRNCLIMFCLVFAFHAVLLHVFVCEWMNVCVNVTFLFYMPMNCNSPFKLLIIVVTFLQTQADALRNLRFYL